MDAARLQVQMIAEEYLKNNDPMGWFEKIYSEAKRDLLAVPWADLVPNPYLIEWLKKNHRKEDGLRALVVGCGLGDDAEELCQWGFKVTAFDIAPTAIEWCKERFKDSKVDYQVVNLFQNPPDWRNSFDFVFEAYTLQVLQSPLRQKAMEHMVPFVKLFGKLLVITHARNLNQDMDGPPWPLIKTELSVFKKCGLKEIALEDIAGIEDPPVRHLRASYVAVDPQLAEKRFWAGLTGANPSQE